MKLLLTIFVLLQVSCMNDSNYERWQPADIVGHSLLLDSKKEVLAFSFSKQGLVAASEGSTDGPVMAPLYYWEINDGGILIIKDDKGSVEYKLRKVSEKDGIVEVRYHGFIRRFKKL